MLMDLERSQVIDRKRQSNRTVDRCLCAWLCSFYASGLSGWSYLL
jgi:hypothetical protein